MTREGAQRGGWPSTPCRTATSARRAQQATPRGERTKGAWGPNGGYLRAVVVDVGAPLSHAIIVSRELGIPCVVSATDATRRIPDSARINVNGDTGVITVLEV